MRLSAGLARFVVVSWLLGLVTGAPVLAQTSAAACGPRPDSAARQVTAIVGELRVCLLALEVPAGDDDSPAGWTARAQTLVLETRQPSDNRRAVIEGTRVTWTINGQPAPPGSVVDQWQSAVVEVAQAKHDAELLRNRVNELRTTIDSLPARIAAAKKRLAYIERRDRELNDVIVNARGRERSVRSDISRAQAARGDAARRAQDAAAQASRAKDEQQRSSLRAAAERMEQQVAQMDELISGLQLQLMDSDASRVIADAQEELRALRPEHTRSLLRLELAAYEATDLDDLRRQLAALDAAATQPVLDARLDAAVARLRALLR